MAEEEKQDQTAAEPEQPEAAEPEAEQPAPEPEAAEPEQPEPEAAEPAPEPAAAPAPAPEPEEQLTPKQARKRARSRPSSPSRPPRSASERAAERAERRATHAAVRRRRRSAERSKHGERGPGTPPAERPPGTRKVRQGTVVSSKPDKTITVEIQVARRHPVYEKVVRRSATLHAHDERNEASEGDVVRIVESRPLSKTKRWRLVEILERAR